uniref:PhoLip_ATPase_C domain-containing protein n=1 Tax=Macrostomum lignano TaxID=282301 RepID=A0A1I8JNN5_9PLAT
MGCFEKLLTFAGLKRPVVSEFRTIYVNHKPLGSSRDQPLIEEKYPSNRIITSRYTILSFPVSPATSIIPLVFVLGVTAVKQAYEDFLRHRADDRVNNTPVHVISGDSMARIKAHEIRVGDVVRVHKNESFPCDLILLASSEESGECSITTANLDGETNLKTVYSVEETKRLQTVEAVCRQLRAKISCEHPTSDLYKFKGNMLLRRQRRSEKPRRCRLALKTCCSEEPCCEILNLCRVWPSIRDSCLTCHPQETKMQLNSQRGRSKKSVVEKRLDRFLLCFMVFLLVESAFCTVMKWVYVSVDAGISGAWYLPSESAQPWRVVQDFLGFVVLFNYLIPISLYVTIELQKFLGSIFFEFDLEMYFEDPETGEKFRAKANTSDLNEELGQVQYLFSDKTGTLTENRMTFRMCSINGNTYCDVDGQLWLTEEGAATHQCQQLNEVELKFFTVLALCHTRTASAASLCRTAMADSFCSSTVCFRYSSLTRTAKCMSVILQRCTDGSYWLLTKGAETSMLEKCSHGDRDAVVKHSGDFAVEGLRVLVIACKELSPALYQQMAAQLLAANQDVANREALTVEAYRVVERDLEALGLTAIEDELQTGVRETITDLRAAGIQVWILTGDKRETAENISLSAGHFDDTMQRIRIVEQQSQAGCLAEVRRGREEISAGDGGYQQAGRRYCLVVDGQSLQFLVAENSAELKAEFLALCQLTSAVLCCRCTPLQKARVVAMSFRFHLNMKLAILYSFLVVMVTIDRSLLLGNQVRNGVEPKPVTCAIGDGANDVSMIREAHVGVGLYGKEGRAAALNSDYAFARFQFLRKALLFHGATCTIAQSLYDTIYLTIYNMTMTSLPILLFGIFEQHVHRYRLYQEPELYITIASNRLLWWRDLLIWCALGLWHSVCCHYGVVAVLAVNDQMGINATFNYGVFEFGALVVQCVMICVTLRLVLVTYSINVPTLIGLVVTVVGFILVMSVYNIIGVNFFAFNNFLWVYFDINKQPVSWLIMLVLTAVSLTPDLLLKCLQDSRNKASMKELQVPEADM